MTKKIWCSKLFLLLCRTDIPWSGRKSILGRFAPENTILTEELAMKRVQCSHCGAVIFLDPSSPTVTCPQCGKVYKNPYFGTVQTQLANHTPSKVLKCPNCGAGISADPASKSLHCRVCGKNYKNPYFSAAASNAAQKSHHDEDDSYEPQFEDEDSYFDGSALKYLGIRILNALQLVFTLGLGYTWTVCRREKWVINHRVVNGKRLVFTGNGGQIFGMWFGGIILCGLTLGLYYFKLKYKMDKYFAEHTHLEDEENVRSEFTADLEGKVGLYVIQSVLTTITFGLYYPWAICRAYRWDLNHQYISGHKLAFDGRGGQLFGHRFLWGLLTLITIGIFGIFAPKKEQQWVAKHLAFKS